MSLAIPAVEVAIFALVSGACYVAAMRLARYDEQLNERLLDLIRDPGTRWQPTLAQRICRCVVRLFEDPDAERGDAVPKGLRSRPMELGDKLKQAGLDTPISSGLFYTTKLALSVGIASLGLAIQVGLPSWGSNMPTAVGAVLGILGLFLPNLWLDQVIRRRNAALRRALPDFLDLMLVCLESGVSVQAGLDRVAEELADTHPVFGSELQKVMRDVELGATVDAAMRSFAERCGEENIHTLATFLTESLRYGTELSETFRSLAEMLRSQREQEAEAAARRAAVKMLLPTLLLIFPAVLVVLVGPAAIKIHDSLGK